MKGHIPGNVNLMIVEIQAFIAFRRWGVSEKDTRCGGANLLEV